MSSHSSSARCSSDVAPVRLSAQGLHELAVQSFRVGNRGRLSLCEALRVLIETRLYLSDLRFLLALILLSGASLVHIATAGARSRRDA